MFIAYHVVTDRPMKVGQVIRFDEENHSGVWQRVMDKLPIVEDILAHPEKYPDKLDHHTDVALRELALEQVRREKFPQYPSRMACLYTSEDLETAEAWGEWFPKWGRPTYAIVKLGVEGRRFIGNANLCFDGTPDQAENLRLAEKYWRIDNSGETERPVPEMLVDGEITVLEIIKEINANL